MRISLSLLLSGKYTHKSALFQLITWNLGLQIYGGKTWKRMREDCLNRSISEDQSLQWFSSEASQFQQPHDQKDQFYPIFLSLTPTTTKWTCLYYNSLIDSKTGWLHFGQWDMVGSNTNGHTPSLRICLGILWDNARQPTTKSSHIRTI